VGPLGGGRYMWYAGTEVGVPLRGSLYLFAGADAGNSVNRSGDLFRNVKGDLFVGGGVLTGYGPIRGGVAFPYDGRMRFTSFRIFLSIGLQF